MVAGAGAVVEAGTGAVVTGACTMAVVGVTSVGATTAEGDNVMGVTPRLTRLA
jgi:hypothetical protein